MHASFQCKCRIVASPKSALASPTTSRGLRTASSLPRPRPPSRAHRPLKMKGQKSTAHNPHPIHNIRPQTETFIKPWLIRGTLMTPSYVPVCNTRCQRRSAMCGDVVCSIGTRRSMRQTKIVCLVLKHVSICLYICHNRLLSHLSHDYVPTTPPPATNTTVTLLLYIVHTPHYCHTSRTGQATEGRRPEVATGQDEMRCATCALDIHTSRAVSHEQ